ncbi:hypothetical protein CAP31_09050 [Sulfuriferula sp. AH1]|uniref:hypothetical protein n=1 Tax=Sulfuriferula sp. AH1 TaxID=1985873 RepID=UPI000B3B55C3|nr:hypothetical protein [Sulfuriferula sp. AH1]ARU31813.1 hypothetical protein CAP31_09050 [Sulfuriferula sp. AH1]
MIESVASQIRDSHIVVFAKFTRSVDEISASLSAMARRVVSFDERLLFMMAALLMSFLLCIIKSTE